MATAKVRPGARVPDGLRGLSPVRFLRSIRSNPLGTLGELAKNYGDAVGLKLGPMRGVMLFGPSHPRHVLVRNHRRYVKGPMFAKMARIGGDGLLFVEGDQWRRHRSMVAPAFQRSRIHALAPHMTDAAMDLTRRWEKEHLDGEPFEVVPEVSKLALDVVSRAMFGTDLLGHAEVFHQSVSSAFEYADRLLGSVVSAPLWVPTRKNRETRNGLTFIHGLLDDMIRSHREAVPIPEDLLGLLLRVRDDTGAPLSEQELHDQLATFVVAGHETTAMTLAWAIWAIGTYPDVEAKLVEEVDRVLGGRPAQGEDVELLPYTGWFVKEVLRLFPPIWVVPRMAIEDDHLDDVLIPKGYQVMLSPFVTQRHPAAWSHPLAFDPERFSPERGEPFQGSAYFPFGLGGRHCIGEDFSILEIVIVLASLLQRFRIVLDPFRVVQSKPLVTLRPDPGVAIRLEDRAGR